MTEYIIRNVTKKEIKSLEEKGFEWYPDSMETNDIVIDGNEDYFLRALKAIRG